MIFKPNIEHLNISGGLGTHILSMRDEDQIVELFKSFDIDKLIYVMNLNDISPLAFQSDTTNLYNPNKFLN